ncbi:MAG TPA: C1 family peptidase [Puia sp.]
MHTNSQRIEELQASLKKSIATWEAGETSLSHLTKEEFARRHGYTPGPGDLTHAERRLKSARNYEAWKKSFDVSTAGSIDWRNNNGNFVTSVKDQGDCGSCVAFGTTATMESMARILLQRPCSGPLNYTLQDLSPADLYYCGGRTCAEGWYPGGALTYANAKGVAPWECFPYTAGDQACQTCNLESFKKTNVGQWGVLATIEGMKYYLGYQGPLIAVVEMPDDFKHYKRGVIQQSGYPPETNHCVSVIGYDDTRQAWLCKNSWGPGWGEGGFFWVGYGQQGIDAEMYSIQTFTQVYELPGVTWQGSDDYDKGEVPSVAMNSSYVVEVHKSQDREDVWYRVGTAGAGFNGSTQYDSGASPFVAINDNNIAVEVHKSQGEDKLWYHVGVIENNKSIAWGGSVEYDTGLFPSVAVNNAGWVVEMHQSNLRTTLWYKIGKLAPNNRITWFGGYELGEGIQPCIAMNNLGQIIEVHQSQDKIGLWYRTGQLNTSTQKITWGDSINYNKGYYPSVALNDSGVVIETHQSNTDTDLWMHTGSLVMSANQVLWTDGRTYDSGYYTRVAINNKTQAMEVHQSQLELKIYYHIGAVTVPS